MNPIRHGIIFPSVPWSIFIIPSSIVVFIEVLKFWGCFKGSGALREKKKKRTVVISIHIIHEHEVNVSGKLGRVVDNLSLLKPSTLLNDEKCE